MMTEDDFSENDYFVPFELPDNIRKSERTRKFKVLNEYVTYMCIDESDIETSNDGRNRFD